jgi:hypothetical protein
MGPVACGGIALRPRSHRDPDGTSDLHDHVRHATDHRLRTDGGSALSPRVVDAPEDRAPAVVVAAAAHFSVE